MTTDPASSSSSSLPARLERGDRIPELGWIGARGQPVALTQSVHAGRLSVLFVCSSVAAPAAGRALSEVRALYDRLSALGVQVFAVTSDPVGDIGAWAAGLGLPFPIVCDAAFGLGRMLGLDPGDTGAADGFALAVVDRNQRLAEIVNPDGAGTPAARALALCEKLSAAMQPTVVTMQAPVLIVPNVLDPEHCARLVRHWETGQRFEGGVANSEVGRNVPVGRIKVREDVVLPDLGPEAQALFAAFRRRLFPEVRKAFNFRITRAESLRLGCYAADDGGHFTLHRDDTTPYTAHRRFAMSLNLNTGAYDGGYLCFPEYGAHQYSVDTGGAVVFSCSLLHEATRITRGRRFVLLGFFYGEAEQALRDRLAAQRQKEEAPARSM